jgi:hypothetical protein
MAATFKEIISKITDCHRCHQITQKAARIGKVIELCTLFGIQ